MQQQQQQQQAKGAPPSETAMLDFRDQKGTNFPDSRVRPRMNLRCCRLSLSLSLVVVGRIGRPHCVRPPGRIGNWKPEKHKGPAANMALDPLGAADTPPKRLAGANAAYLAGDRSTPSPRSPHGAAIATDSAQFSSTGALPPSSPSPTPASVAGTVSTIMSSSAMSAAHILGGVANASTSSHSGSGMSNAGGSGVSSASFVGSAQTPPPVDPELDAQRATHTIRLSALRHNYAIVEDAASRQRCSVIVVVKADGYGHGAVETAVHLADYCGADAFAVATLEEGIALRRALALPTATGSGGIGPATAAAPAPVGSHSGAGGGVEFGMMPASGAAAASAAAAVPLDGSLPPSRRASELNSLAATAPGIAGLFRPPSPSIATSSSQSPSRLNPSSSSGGSVSSHTGAQQSMKVGPGSAAGTALPPRNRAPRIRILVLGPPVGYPRSFDLYHHHQIEVMVSGPEVARALMEWVSNVEERKRTEVQRAAAEYMGEALTRHVGMVRVGLKGTGKGAIDDDPTSDEQTERGDNPDLDDKEDEKKDDNAEPDSTKAALPTTEQNGRSKPPRPRPGPSTSESTVTARAGNGSAPAAPIAKKAPPLRKASQLSQNVGASATLSNVTGDDLAKEVRAILLNQQAVAVHLQKQKEAEPLQKKKSAISRDVSSEKLDGEASSVPPADTNSPANTAGSTPAQATSSGINTQNQQQQTLGAPTANAGATGAPTIARPGTNIAPFRGIEEAAKISRDRQLAARARREAEEEARAAEKAQEDDGGDDVIVQPNAVGVHPGAGASGPKPGPVLPQGQQPPAQQRKRLRWHALVDSGMGRLGFKPDAPGKGDVLTANTSVIKPRKPRYSETIALIKELHDAEVRDNAPLEFFGMCTHMADATSTSTYTHSQMDRFLTLLDNVRAAGISVPTVSTDNSAALLTTTLNHFDPSRILSQPGADTRGFVRTGGAIYGQRPTFPQLRAISTLTASVRHVSVIKAGDSVGYDRAYTAPMDVRIATLTIGFADGYPRELGNGVGRVSIQGSAFPVAGNVCMDMMMVCLGPAGAAGPGALVAVGDVATLWGPEGPDDDTDGLVRLQDIAKSLKTTQSALTCGLDKVRVERKYKV